MRTVPDFQPPTQEDTRADLREALRGAVRFVIETFLEEEVREMVGADRWQQMRTRKDFRNGSYFRRLMTTMGYVQVEVPRAREGGAPTETLGRYRRRSPELDATITEAYLHGVSTRKMSEITEAMMGASVGRSTVSRVTRSLEEQVERLRRAPIEGPVPYLYLDATFLDARWARQVENVSALVAYGVDQFGHRQLLAVTIGPEESEATWAELLKQLNERGLTGVQLVIADDHAGLKAAVRHHLPEARLQRCTVHLIRNVLAKAPQRLRGKLARRVSEVFKAPSLGEARRRAAELKRDLDKHVPEAVACLENGFDAATQFFAFPRAHWHRIRSTNGLERLHGEIKRRIRSVGAFPDRASALRLITAVALHVTSIWSDRKYLDVRSLVDRPAGARVAA
jgi:transposase-like protein